MGSSVCVCLVKTKKQKHVTLPHVKNIYGSDFLRVRALMSTRRELLGEDGIVAAANAIGNTIMKLDKGKLGEHE